MKRWSIKGGDKKIMKGTEDHILLSMEVMMPLTHRQKKNFFFAFQHFHYHISVEHGEKSSHTKFDMD